MLARARLFADRHGALNRTMAHAMRRATVCATTPTCLPTAAAALPTMAISRLATSPAAVTITALAMSTATASVRSSQ